MSASMNAHLASARTPSPASLFMSSGAVSRYFFTAGAGARAGPGRSVIQLSVSRFTSPFLVHVAKRNRRRAYIAYWPPTLKMASRAVPEMLLFRLCFTRRSRAFDERGYAPDCSRALIRGGSRRSPSSNALLPIQVLDIVIGSGKMRHLQLSRAK